MTIESTTEKIYDRQSADWNRNEPILLSDYTARPFLLDWCEPVEGLDILDLGCGEGYFARNLKTRGAGPIQAMDLSGEMIARAQEREATEQLGIVYGTGSATDLSRFADDSFDTVVAVFLFNYLDSADTEKTMREVHRVLRPGGRFVFAVPHPFLPFAKEEEEPFYFRTEGAGYFSGRDTCFEGEIWRRDGKSVHVRCVHKTLDDYFRCLKNAGFRAMPETRELRTDDDMEALDPAFFGPLADLPLHLAFRVEKS